MKRILLFVTTMLVTFALGLGIQSFVSWYQVEHPAPVEAINVAPLATTAPLFAPAPRIPAVSADTPEPILILDYDPEEFVPWAVFRVMGRKPKEFADIDSIELGLSRNLEKQGGYMSLFTCVPGNCKSARGTFALVTKQRLFLATAKMANTEFEYWFDGRFLRTDFEAVEGKGVAVLRGTLTKTKNGRKIAEHTFTFRMEPLGC